MQNPHTKDVIIGQKVRNKGFDVAKNPRYFSNFKRGIGTDIQGYLPEIDGKTITFEEIGELYLNQIIPQLNEDDSLIVTVPVNSFETYRFWLNDVCKNWNIPKIRIVDEPTAAALGYGSENDRYVLVVDFGGGTIDFSLVELDFGKSNTTQGFILKWGENSFGKDSAQKPKLAKVMGKAGANLGGCDIDNWILDYFQEKQGVEKTSVTSRLAERLKIRLSKEAEVEEAFFDDINLDTYEFKLNIQQFEQILTDHDFFTKLDSLMSNVLQQGQGNGINKYDIDRVLLIGGSGQIPAVQSWLGTHFPEKKIKKDKPFDAVAMGALKLDQGLQIKDFLYHSYGIRYWNRRENRHDWHTIIPQGQPYPMQRPIELILGASVDDQPRIELILGELAEENVKTEVYFDGDRLVTRNVEMSGKQVQPLNDTEGGKNIADLKPLGKPGNDRIKVLFNVDSDRCLKITVEDLLTMETLLENAIVAQLS